MLMAIDPGTTESAYVVYDRGAFIEFNKVANEEILVLLDSYVGPVVIEMVACYGMPVGAEVFETCVWIGRMIEHAGVLNVERMKRNEVKMALCHRTKGVNDGVIRQALIDMFGPSKECAVGKKKSPGPLFGMSGDVWQAAALAVAFELRTLK